MKFFYSLYPNMKITTESGKTVTFESGEAVVDDAELAAELVALGFDHEGETVKQPRPRSRAKSQVDSTDPSEV